MDVFISSKMQKNECNFYHFFKVLLNDYDGDAKCLLDKVEKRHYSFLCPLCKMVTFSDFERAANESWVIFLKRRQSVVKLCEKNKE